MTASSNHAFRTIAMLRACVCIVLSILAPVSVWAGDATVPVPVTGPVTVLGDTVTLPSGTVSSTGSLVMIPNVKAVIQAGTTIQSGGTLAVRVNMTPPTITAIANQVINEDSATAALPFTIGDAEVPIANLSLSVASSDPTIATASLGGSGANRTVTVTGVANQFTTTPVTITVTVGDGRFTTPTAFTVAINSVNDRPSFTIAPGASVTVADNAGAQTRTAWATGISVGPANESSQTVSFTCSGYDPRLFAVVPQISSSGDLTFTPATSTFGTATATVTVSAQDSGGTANGGQDTSLTTQSFTITITDHVFDALPSHTRYVVASETSYPTQTTSPSASDRLTTTYAYTWVAGAQEVASTTVTLPVVTTATNGPDNTTPTTLSQTYDCYARPVWERDGTGYLSYHAYDPFSGAETLSIRDVDTTKTGDFTKLPSGWSTPAGSATQVAGGLHLKTQTQVDLLGRPVLVTEPGGQATGLAYDDVAHAVRVYAGWTGSVATGPTRMVRENWAGTADTDGAYGYRETLTMTAVPTASGGKPTGQEAVSGVQSLTREVLDDNGRTRFVDRYVKLAGLAYATTTTVLGTQSTWAAPTGNFERLSIGYTPRGFVERVVRPDGTIERAVVDFLGRVTARWKGTDDSGWTPTSTDTLANFKRTALRSYDADGVGDGLLTSLQAVSDSATYTTYHLYDGYDRRVRTLTPDGLLTVRTVDNLDRTTRREVYAGILPANLAATPASTALRARTDLAYDPVGAVWQTTAWAVAPSTSTSPAPGTATDYLLTKRWYDRRGLPLKVATGTTGAFSKNRYDGAERVVASWDGSDSSETTWADAASSTNDLVAAASTTVYDPSSRPLLDTIFRRKDGDTTTTGMPTAVNAHLDVRVRWFDAAHRITAAATYGRDPDHLVYDASGNLLLSGGLPTVAAGAAPTPNSSDQVRVTAVSYDSAGLPSQVTDNLGRQTRSTFDSAGRRLSTIANYVDGAVAANESDTDQITSVDLLPGGTVGKRHSQVGGASGMIDQITTYLHDSTIDRAWATGVIYPDSGDTTSAGSDQVKTAYDRLGRRTSRTDQRGVVRSFTYDAAGRFQADAATTIPTGLGIDTAVRRLERGYTDIGQVATLTSYDAVSGGTALNQVARTYGAWGELLQEQQDHATTVGTGSPKVGYTLDAGVVSNVARSLRRTGVIYPSATYGVGYRYATSGLEYALDRVQALTNPANAGADIAQEAWIGEDVLARVTLPTAGSAVMDRSTNGTADGYDRFWTETSHAWKVGGSGIDGFTYKYDRGGRLTVRWAAWATTRLDRDEVATYDGLDRLLTHKRGQADASGVIAAGTSRKDWSWTLDSVGNWKSYTVDGDGAAGATAALVQTRAHNKANEIDVDDDDANAAGASITGTGMTWTAPTYDKAGAMTTIPAPGAETTARTLTWDAWGRLVAVAQAGSTIWTARYDAAHRLIRWVAGGVTNDSYLDDQAREIELRRNGLIQESYIWDLAGDRMITYARSSASNGIIDQTLVALSDMQGSVTALMSGSTVVERYRYDAYGVRTIYAADGTTVLASSAYAARYAYTGRPIDATTGLMYYRARWYHASLGRFISRDPAGYVDGGNLYQYVVGNPLWWTDPSGLKKGIGDSAMEFLKRIVLPPTAAMNGGALAAESLSLDAALSTHSNQAQAHRADVAWRHKMGGIEAEGVYWSKVLATRDRVPGWNWGRGQLKYAMDANQKMYSGMATAPFWMPGFGVGFGAWATAAEAGQVARTAETAGEVAVTNERYLLHGTDEASAEKIINNGLSRDAMEAAENGQADLHGFHMTTCPEDAAGYAQSAAGDRGGKAAVIRIPYSRVAPFVQVRPDRMGELIIPLEDFDKVPGGVFDYAPGSPYLPSMDVPWWVPPAP